MEPVEHLVSITGYVSVQGSVCCRCVFSVSAQSKACRIEPEKCVSVVFFQGWTTDPGEPRTPLNPEEEDVRAGRPMDDGKKERK